MREEVLRVSVTVEDFMFPCQRVQQSFLPLPVLSHYLKLNISHTNQSLVILYSANQHLSPASLSLMQDHFLVALLRQPGTCCHYSWSLAIVSYITCEHSETVLILIHLQCFSCNCHQIKIMRLCSGRKCCFVISTSDQCSLVSLSLLTWHS